ncbi:MAG: nucleotidyltransferase domain-containing protein [Oscillospiraceae bacterium]|nr:nucleotidyltransferase domain-containing protein [Oscillospiraceae bacterium]
MATKQQIQEISQRVHERMMELFGEKLNSVILYGSYARGDYEEFSDIDMMILVNIDKYELTEYRDEVWDFAEDIGRDYDYEVLLSLKLQDMETFSAWEHVLPYYKNVAREGIRING